MHENDRTPGFQRFAGGLAHDFNNLFMAIAGNTELARMELPEGSMARECLDDIAEATRRGVERCNEMMVYAGRRPLDLEPLDPGRLVAERVHDARQRWGDNTPMDTHIADGLPTLDADPRRLGRLLDALLDNARQAIAGGGTISVTVAHDAGHTFVAVEDDGAGMDDTNRHTMFDPYFTTSESNKGLGLAWLTGVMEAHQGSVEVRTAPAEGTTVRLVFPTLSIVG